MKIKEVFSKVLFSAIASRGDLLNANGDFFSTAIDADGKLKLDGAPHGIFSYKLSISPSMDGDQEEVTFCICLIVLAVARHGIKNAHQGHKQHD